MRTNQIFNIKFCHTASISKVNLLSHRFPVSADMAPISSLLVYYVTEAGEPVSDVVNFHVKLLHKEVMYY